MEEGPRWDGKGALRRLEIYPTPEGKRAANDSHPCDFPTQVTAESNEEVSSEEPRRESDGFVKASFESAPVSFDDSECCESGSDEAIVCEVGISQAILACEALVKLSLFESGSSCDDSGVSLPDGGRESVRDRCEGTSSWGSNGRDFRRVLCRRF
jgi:hypothetical protein